MSKTVAELMAVLRNKSEQNKVLPSTVRLALHWPHHNLSQVETMKLGNPPKRVAEYVLKLADEKGVPLTPMQVLKLVYISHGWQLGLYGRPLISEPIEAWQYGPVVPSVYHQYKRFGSRFIDDIPSELPSGFDNSEASTLRQVFDGYGKRTGISLSSLTHEPGTPWSITVAQSGIGAVISNDLIEDYYRRQALAK